MTALGIRAVGAVTAVGEDAPATVGSIFTDAQAFDPLAIKMANGRPVIGAATPIPADVKGIDRLVMLGTYALREAAGGLTQGTEIGLAVCAPSEQDEEDLDGQAPAFLTRLAAEAGVILAPKVSRVFSSGCKATIGALVFAQTMLRSRDLAAVCVLGVDSLVTKARLGKLLRSNSAPMERFVPGEGSAAILLSRRLASDSLAILAGVGIGKEPSCRAQAQQPNLGKGFISAIDKAVADTRLVKPAFAAVVHDLPAAGNEELTWVEQCPAFRTLPGMHILSPAFSVGETGAACGILSLVTLAFLIGRKEVTAPGLCLFASENAYRGAAVLTPPPQARRK